MIDAFYIFTRGGLLLWSTQLVKVKGSPLDRLIKEVLLEERVGETTATLNEYSMKWMLLNEMDLFFVVVYQGIVQIVYLERLLQLALDEFLKHIAGGFGNGLIIKHVDFDADFLKLRQKADKELREAKRPSVMRSFADTKKGNQILENKGPSSAPNKSAKGGTDDNEDDDERSAEARKKLATNAKGKSKSEPEKEKKDKKESKKATHWDGGKVSKSVAEGLDFSRKKVTDEDGEREAAALKAKQEDFLGSGDEEVSDSDVESLQSDDAADEVADSKDGKAKDSKAGGLFKNLTRRMSNITGGAVLERSDLEPILHTFKDQLMAKNVAAEVADKIADSVLIKLVGKKTESFTSMASTVKVALKESMETILTPKKSIDILRAALAAKAAGKVYSIVFLGVNGVGKSTNLAKVAYYLKNKGGLDVMLCACDTFRAGAVEQLKTHARCLDVPLFEQGYGKDPAMIAKNALIEAKKNGNEVVLIDTAGRMQDNEPLMRALAKLVAINSPDLVLFVGEALVGNDAIDQVTKFNRSLTDLSTDGGNRRGIDGMLLTKYDTVDDKVGAAVSMVYVTGQPIVFVGSGQKYTHLRKLQAKEVVKTLLG